MKPRHSIGEDGSILEGASEGVIVGACRDSTGYLFAGFVKSVRASFAVCVEALVLEESLSYLETRFDMKSVTDLLFEI